MSAPASMMFGQYYPADSVVHRLDPRAKFAAAGSFLVAPFLVQSIAGLSLLWVTVALVAVASKVPVKWMLRGARPVAYILVFTVLVHALKVSGNGPSGLISAGPLVVAPEGLVDGLFYALRLILLVAGTSILTQTTPPLALAEGLESLLRPLRMLRLPAQEIALMISLSLRFVPMLLSEAERMMKAQTARGADFAEGSLVKRGRNYLSLLIPMFVGAFRRAKDLGEALDARCFHAATARTTYSQLVWTWRDSVAIITVLVTLALAVAASRVFLGG